MIAIRIFIGVILAAIVAVASVPLLVLLDLVGGGDGWGICQRGLGSCRTGYFTGPELIGVLMLALFVLLGVLRVAVLMLRRMRARRDASRQLPVAG